MTPTKLGQAFVFPPEIEEIVFSLAFYSNWRDTPRLVLVSKRVYERLIPHIYKLVIFGANEGPKFDSGKLATHGKHVRQMSFTYGLPSRPHHRPGECLTWCPNVFNVSLRIPYSFYDKNLIDQLLKLRITHLSFDIASLERFLTATPEISSTSIVFPYVTHLELINSTTSIKPTHLKTRFPILTHLSLNGNTAVLVQASSDILKVWKDQIKVLITYLGMWRPGVTPMGIPKLNMVGIELPKDLRVVVLNFESGDSDWVPAAVWWMTTMMSVWRFADEVVKAREAEAEVGDWDSGS